MGGNCTRLLGSTHEELSTTSLLVVTLDYIEDIWFYRYRYMHWENMGETKAVRVGWWASQVGKLARRAAETPVFVTVVSGSRGWGTGKGGGEDLPAALSLVRGGRSPSCPSPGSRTWGI